MYINLGKNLSHHEFSSKFHINTVMYVKSIRMDHKKWKRKENNLVKEKKPVENSEI